MGSLGKRIRMQELHTLLIRLSRTATDISSMQLPLKLSHHHQGYR
jgi:hypothetical protein